MSEILVPETPIKCSKLDKLIQVFGSSRSESALSKALANANGELDLAIMYAAVEPPIECKSLDIRQVSVPIEPIKRKKLVKKADLEKGNFCEINVISDDKVNVISDDKVNVISDDKVNVISDDIDFNDFIKGNQAKKRKLVKKADLESSDDEENVLSISSDEEEESEASENDENNFETVTVLYFNSCADDQLMETTGCSKDDAAFITSQRPFTSFRQLQDSLKVKRRYGAILDKYVEMMKGFAKVDQLIEETRAYGDDINVNSYINFLEYA
jgi:hypothetical protein